MEVLSFFIWKSQYCVEKVQWWWLWLSQGWRVQGSRNGAETGDHRHWKTGSITIGHTTKNHQGSSWILMNCRFFFWMTAIWVLNVRIMSPNGLSDGLQTDVRGRTHKQWIPGIFDKRWGRVEFDSNDWWGQPGLVLPGFQLHPHLWDFLEESLGFQWSGVIFGKQSVASRCLMCFYH